MTDENHEKWLERVIASLVEQRHAAPDGSAARRMAERQLKGLRYTYEGAGGIIEDLEMELGEDYGYSIKITGPRPRPPALPRPRGRTAGSCPR